jgi:hypothetical protein
LRPPRARCLDSWPRGRETAGVTPWSGGGSAAGSRSAACAHEPPSNRSPARTGRFGLRSESVFRGAGVSRWGDGTVRWSCQPVEQASRDGSRQNHVRPRAAGAKPTTKFVQLERCLAHTSEAGPGRRVAVDSRLHVDGLYLECIVVLAARSAAWANVRSSADVGMVACGCATAPHRCVADRSRWVRDRGPARVFAHEIGVAMARGAKRRAGRQVIPTGDSSPACARNVKPPNLESSRGN